MIDNSTVVPGRVEVLGVPVDPLSVDELHERIHCAVRNDQRATILHVNVLALNLAYEQPAIKEIFHRADVVFCDGVGVKLGARLLGQRIPARSTYADWVWDLAGLAVENGFSLYFLGGRPGVAETASERLRTRYPGLRVVGVRHGYFDKERNSRDNREVLDDVRQVNPDILLVGFGMPMQEHWVAENRADIPARVVLTGGAVFDYTAGRLRRAPRWLTQNGMEWLGRLLIEPKRLWRRYLIGNPMFLVRVLRQAMRQRAGSGERERRG